MINCTVWLRQYLEGAGHEVWVDVVREAAKACGYSKEELKAARKQLGVVTLNDNFTTGADRLRWWALPEQAL